MDIIEKGMNAAKRDLFNWTDCQVLDAIFTHDKPQN